MRKRAQQGNAPQRVLGILLGVQVSAGARRRTWRGVVARRSGEEENDRIGLTRGGGICDPNVHKILRISNSTQRVKSGEALPGDIEIHREIGSIIENPLYLILDTSEGAGFTCFWQVHIIEDVPALTFARSTYHLETEEAERVSVDQASDWRCARLEFTSAQVSHLLPAGASSASSVMSSHMSSVHSAVTMLQKRVQCILSLLQVSAMPRSSVVGA
eukprot:752845-Hanusia_phi.AAC.2